MAKPPTRLTKGHVRLHDILVQIGLAVEDEVRFGKYKVDCYVPEIHMAFEYDGPLHFRPSQKRKDIQRDKELLEDFKLPIMRVVEKDFQTEELIDRIMYFILKHSVDVEERKQGVTWQTTEPWQ